MKLLNRCAFILALTAVIVSSPDSAADVVYKTWTLKNMSAETADDLHIVVTNRAGTVVEPVSKARSQAFSDPPQGEGTATLDWPKTGGGGTVPAGFSDKVAICNEDNDFLLDFFNTNFTARGRPLSTGYVTHTWSWDVDQDGSVTFNYQNPGASDQGAILIKNLDIYINNSLQLYMIDEASFPYENPSGSLAASISNVPLSPGQSGAPIPLGMPDIASKYLLMLATIAPQSNPNDDYFVAGGFSTVPEPLTIAQAAVGAAYLLGFGVFRRRRCQPWVERIAAQ